MFYAIHNQKCQVMKFMNSSKHNREIMREAHRQYAQSHRLGLDWTFGRALAFAHHKIAGKRASVEAQMQEIRRSIEALAFKPGPYGQRKGHQSWG